MNWQLKDEEYLDKLIKEGKKLFIAGKPPQEIAGTYEPDVRSYNIGDSDYSKHKIQPWQIWIEYKLNPFDADIVKRVLRHKKTDSRKMDYEKIIHICKERIRQIDSGCDVWAEQEE